MPIKLTRRLLPHIGRQRCAECGKPAKETYCEICGPAQLDRMRAQTLERHRPS